MNQIAAIKAPLPVAEGAPGRQTAISASAQGVKTGEIAPENTVSPAQHSEPSRPRVTKSQQDFTLPEEPTAPAPAFADEEAKPSPQPVARATVKNIEFDSATRDVIFQSLSEDTGEVIAQVPSEALLRIREYVRGKKADGPTGLVRQTA